MNDMLETIPSHHTAATLASTIPAAFQVTVEQHPDLVAFAATDGLPAQTFGEYGREVAAAAAALDGLGLRRGDTIALMLTNRREFHWVDAAAMHLGITTTSVYNTSPAELLEHVVTDSGARVLVTERAFAARFAGLPDGLLETTVLVDEAASDAEHLGWSDFLAETTGRLDLEGAWRAVEPGDVACLIYTSGSTGAPKGVELTHRNMMFLMASLQDRCRVPFASPQLSFLPMAHMMARISDHYMQMGLALEVTCCPDPTQVGRYLPTVRPGFFASTPRLYEKLRGAILAAISGLPQDRRVRTEAVLADALSQVHAAQVALAEGAVAASPPSLSEADRALLTSLARLVGLDRAAYAIIGGAPVAADLVEFFLALGVPLGEAYGLTESGAAATGNPPDRIRAGTVGPALTGIELQLAEDGEVLLRSDGVMKGYRNNPVATAEAISPEGWLHTGDVGAMEPDGYLRIIDRKKEIMINAAGKNMSPAQIEATLKQSCPLIGHAVVVGEGRRYVVALVSPDHDALSDFAARHGLTGVDQADLASHPAVLAEIAAGIERGNERLSRVEQIKRHRVLTEPWLPGGDELTATMKLRRRVVNAKYLSLIEELYAE